MKLLPLISGLLLVQGIVAHVAVRNDDDDCTDDRGKHCKVRNRCQGLCQTDDWFMTQNNNCGRCGTVCTNGKVCWDGKCNCGEDKKWCNSECKDLSRDRDNCGSCGNKVSRLHPVTDILPLTFPLLSAKTTRRARAGRRSLGARMARNGAMASARTSRGTAITVVNAARR
jgi:hypothetical protein